MNQNLKNKYLELYEKYGEIKIACKAAAELPLDVIADFQGGLKKRTADNKIKLATQIFKKGFIAPFFIWDYQGAYYALDGHARSEVLCEIREAGIPIPGLFPVAYIEAENEQDAKEKLLGITSQYGEFVEDELNEWIKNIDNEIKESLRILDKELRINNEEETIEDDEIPKQIDPITKLGDLWELGRHRLLCGDSTKEEDVKKLMNDEKADMVFTDPPYGIEVVKGEQIGGESKTKFGKIDGGKIVNSSTYKKIIGDDTTETAKKFYNICLKLNIKNIVIWGGNYYTDFLPISKCWFIWNKEMTGNFSEAEMAWTSFTKGGIKVFKHLWNGLSREGNRIDELVNRVHPTQKPVNLFSEIFTIFDLIKIILDGFLGSGSTLIACEKTNRICYGMEIEPHYCDIIVERYKNWCQANNINPIIKLNGEIYCH